MPLSAYSRSHLSLLGPAMIIRDLEEAGITVTTSGDLPIYIEPGSARTSALFTKLNPPQLYPYNESVRFVDGAPSHPADVGHPELALTEDEYYLLILNADMGGQFYSRENAPSGTY
jgi:hypothetical protein